MIVSMEDGEVGEPKFIQGMHGATATIVENIQYWGNYD